MWRKLQGQSVRGVPALQQFHLCREGRPHRGRGRRCCTHFSERGSPNLPHTQVSTVGNFRLPVWPYSTWSNKATVCYLQDVKSQATEETEHAATVLESQTQSLIPVLVPLFSHRWESLSFLEPVVHQTGINQQRRFKGRLPADNSSSFIVSFPNSGRFEGSCNLLAHAVTVWNTCKWVGA